MLSNWSGLHELDFVCPEYRALNKAALDGYFLEPDAVGWENFEGIRHLLKDGDAVYRSRKTKFYFRLIMKEK